jgi:PAB1-binding protein PBP1
MHGDLRHEGKLQSTLSTPSAQPSPVVMGPGSTPYQDSDHQVYPEPQVEPLMGMNKDQDQHPGKDNPQYSGPGLRDKEPPHVDPSDK